MGKSSVIQALLLVVPFTSNSFSSLCCHCCIRTRVVQKLIETLKGRREISLVMAALQPGFLDLIKDLNGNHVIKRCLQCLSNEDNKVHNFFPFIFIPSVQYRSIRCMSSASVQYRSIPTVSFEVLKFFKLLCAKL